MRRATKTHQSSLGDKLHLFGILLAELLLGEPIDLQADLRANIKSTTANIYWILSKDVSANAASAVHFCFQSSGNGKWDTTKDELANEQRAELVYNELEPVKKHYETIRGHCKTQSKYVDDVFLFAQDHADGAFS
ncbi:collagen triple helix repeat (20 copies) domain-containing protein [Penicillium desertorum]|uniref:Collagen triple helix repeat (20 copies) domain-containing protein n=1 Tax=Penicillium desertorum TaxID=1303715 RepID=A0A9W9WHS6_9EURO|nr:collagen triple helix repeat (20 copies) domain-containing protein [Penicillium desertorum]